MAPKGQLKTHCKNGHELTDDNISMWIRKNGYVNRNCLKCAKQNTTRYKQKHPDRVKAYKEKLKMARPKILRRTTTHCKYGHEWTPDNIYKYKSQDGKEVIECRICVKNKSVRRKRQNRDAHLRRKFGLSLETFEKMLESQNGRCANLKCLTAEPGGMGAFHVDHDHNTNKLRELLCSRCNTVLGMVNDDPEIIQGLIDYLRKHSA